MKNSILYLLTFLYTLSNCDLVNSEPNPLLVSLKDGDLRPLIEKSRLGEYYYSFLGIPYAKPPIGNLRFQPPEPAEPWRGVLDATKFGPVCAQFDLATWSVIGSEDCLHLNVFKPNINSTEKLPVMVWIHNGAYMFSTSTNYKADYFMDEKVILVTFNYRLGVLGFLNAGVEEARGNMGLKDQVLVLKWVQQNIDKFGGDANKVTIFGDLAGGASVHYHMYNEMSKGLFSAAISQGGSSLCTWAYIQNPTKMATLLGEFIGLPNEHNKTKLVMKLKELNTTELVATIPKFFEWGVNQINPFGPSVERVGDNQGKFLNETPYWSLQKQPVNNVPWIVGMNDELGLAAAIFIVTNPKSTEDFNKDWYQLAPLVFYYRNMALDRNGVSDSIRKEYFENKKIDLDTLKQLTDLYSHRLFFQGIRKALVSHLKNTVESQPVYLYILSHRSHSSYIRDVPPAANISAGPTEGDELQYLFKLSKPYEEIGPHHPHYEFSVNLIRLWVHFATHRNTNAQWNNQPVVWERASVDKIVGGDALQFLDINTNLSSVTEPFKKHLDFWDKLPINEFEREVLESN